MSPPTSADPLAMGANSEMRAVAMSASISIVEWIPSIERSQVIGRTEPHEFAVRRWESVPCGHGEIEPNNAGGRQVERRGGFGPNTASDQFL